MHVRQSAITDGFPKKNQRNIMVMIMLIVWRAGEMSHSNRDLHSAAMCPIFFFLYGRARHIIQDHVCTVFGFRCAANVPHSIISANFPGVHLRQTKTADRPGSQRYSDLLLLSFAAASDGGTNYNIKTDKLCGQIIFMTISEFAYYDDTVEFERMKRKRTQKN